ncbi:MAG TPA: TolC family protein [Verrucomicrobiaceae bacterium]|jgi:outer membrane protein TolC
MKSIFCFLNFLLLVHGGLMPAADATQHDVPASSDVLSISLDTVTHAVMENQPALKEARAKWEAARQRVPQAAAWEDPKLSAGSRVARFVRVAPNSFGDQMLSLEQMLPISGKNASRARIAAAEALMAAEEVRRKELDLISKARASYYGLTVQYALLDLNKADEESLRQMLDITRAKLEVGGQSQADVLTAENELTKVHESRQDLLRAISEEETRLSVLINRDPFKPLGTPADQIPAVANFSVDHLKSLLLASRPEVRASEDALVLAKEKIALAKKAWIPDPTLSVQGQRYNEAAQAVSEVAVGISISIPWFNRGKYRAEEQEAARGAEAALHAAEAVRLEALGMLRDQLRKIETERHHIEFYREKLLPTAQQTVESMRAAYETDKKGFLDLVSAQRSLRDHQKMLQKHLGEYGAAVAELDAIVGADCNPHPVPKTKSKPARK